MRLRRFSYKIFLTGLLSTLGLVGFAQEDDEYWKKLLNEEVEVENPVYMPVISIGAGVLSFYGDIKNPGTTLLSGRNGYKINGSTLVGKKNYFKLNFFGLYGGLSGQDFNISRAMQLAPLPTDDLGADIFPNSSFSTDLIQLGVNFEYGFAHLIRNSKQFRPFISVGVSTLIFSPKGDLTYGGSTTSYYHFWSDGTIRNFSQNGLDAWNAKPIPFDRKYETDLSSKKLYRSSYSQNSIAFPIEVGFDFYLSYRVNLRIATTVNYALTDILDNYDSKVAKAIGLKAKGYNDIFTFTYFSMNFDLFSDAKTIMIEKVFADLGDNFDYDIFLADQDNDGILDAMDQCPDTPSGVAVDSTSGCPFDSDKDGVYDYIDQEANTPVGATIDDNGIQLSEDKLAEMFNQKNAVLRKEIRVIPVAKIWTRSITFAPGIIPEKFKSVDTDGDGYISFTELLKTIDDYFDQKITLTPEEVYELNDFFFSQ